MGISGCLGFAVPCSLKEGGLMKEFCLEEPGLLSLSPRSKLCQLMLNCFTFQKHDEPWENVPKSPSFCHVQPRRVWDLELPLLFTTAPCSPEQAGAGSGQLATLWFNLSGTWEYRTKPHHKSHSPHPAMKFIWTASSGYFLELFILPWTVNSYRKVIYDLEGMLLTS